MSHELNLPPELEHFSMSFDIALPDQRERVRMVHELANEWANENPGAAVQADKRAFDLLIANLAGLTHGDTRRLARNAIFQDGAITKSDIGPVMEAKYRLLNREGVLSYEYDTAEFRNVGGQRRLKEWLDQRRPAFRGEATHLDPPKGLLLLGVQGCGKSLAAKAVAGMLEVPLLRLDFGRLFNKFHGETERRLRSALKMADVMAPCVLWIDEIEKSIAGENESTGTTQRVLGTFLTWLAEKKQTVFVVATANNVDSLPPELMRKGRFDEIFFVDLPCPETRQEIFRVHLRQRDLDTSTFDIARLANQADGFSGAEIEQAVVSAMYTAHAQKHELSDFHLISELRGTYPLSTTMSEKIHALRAWAKDRTTTVD